MTLEIRELIHDCLYLARQEYAGLGGDAHFIKAEQEGSISRWLGGGYVRALFRTSH
jgi:hypothetical protein